MGTQVLYALGGKHFKYWKLVGSYKLATVQHNHHHLKNHFAYGNKMDR